MRSWFRPLLVLMISLMVGLGVFFFIREQQQHRIPMLGQVGEMTLQRADGVDFQRGDLHRMVWIVSFHSVDSPQTNHLLHENMAFLHRAFHLSRALKLVTITTSPIEMVQTLKQNLARQYDDQLRNWLFLTGEDDHIRHLGQNVFRLDDLTEDLNSQWLALVDRNGIIRGYYQADKKEEVNRLFRDAARLLKER